MICDGMVLSIHKIGRYGGMYGGIYVGMYSCHVHVCAYRSDCVGLGLGEKGFGCVGSVGSDAERIG